MKKYVKRVFKSIVLSATLLTLFYALSAFFILKNEWGNNAYYISAVIIHCLTGLVLSLIFQKDRNFLDIVPVIVFDISLFIIFQKFHYRFVLLPISAIGVYYLIGLIQRIKLSKKKNSIKQIRRNYERLHKK
ncbi:MAG: hypothetical protein E7517_00505 [Ruminococcaceae bacterium]|nr:hypothetical protein [Oscillospiraceae bacterium]